MADKKISALTAASTPLAGSEVLPIVQGGATVKVSVDNLTVGKNVEMNRLTANAVSGTSGIFKTSAATGSNFVTFNDTAIKFYLGYTSGGNENFDLVNMENGSIGLGNNGAYGLRIETTNDVTAVTGNFIVGTAAKGIDFSANTGTAGMTSELLNWYEEGTWTTTVTNPSNFTGTPTLSNGKYTRVGRLVMIEGKFSGDVTALLTNTFFQFTLPIARAAATDSGAGNVMTATALKLGGIENAGADTTTAYVVMPSNSGQPIGVDTFLFTYTYSA